MQTLHHFCLYLDTSSHDHDGQHHPGDHRLHEAEEDLQAACPPPPGGTFQVGWTADGGWVAPLPPLPCYRWDHLIDYNFMTLMGFMLAWNCWLHLTLLRSWILLLVLEPKSFRPIGDYFRCKEGEKKLFVRKQQWRLFKRLTWRLLKHHVLY